MVYDLNVMAGCPAEREMLETGVTRLGPHSQFAECAGLRSVTVERDRATILLEPGPAVLGADGGVHRGAISALIEAAGSAAAVREIGACDEDSPGSVDLFISFVRTAPEQPLTADAHVMRREAGLSVCDVEVRDWDLRLVAKAVFTYRR
jgi:uncharacterized protein (TIGR00369 family)